MFTVSDNTKDRISNEVILRFHLIIFRTKAEDREEEKDCEGNGSEQAAYPAKFNISARLFLAEQSRLKIQ